VPGRRGSPDAVTGSIPVASAPRPAGRATARRDETGPPAKGGFRASDPARRADPALGACLRSPAPAPAGSGHQPRPRRFRAVPSGVAAALRLRCGGDAVASPDWFRPVPRGADGDGAAVDGPRGTCAPPGVTYVRAGLRHLPRGGCATVAAWEAHDVHPRPELRAALDTALARADGDARERFTAALRLARPTDSAPPRSPASCARRWDESSTDAPAAFLADDRELGPSGVGGQCPGGRPPAICAVVWVTTGPVSVGPVWGTTSAGTSCGRILPSRMSSA
jgi:hypothetical protein